MTDRTSSDETSEAGAVGSRPKVWTAIRHGSALVVFLGLFVAISAYATDPKSGMITVGWIIAGVGVVGFLAGYLASRGKRS